MEVVMTNKDVDYVDRNTIESGVYIVKGLFKVIYWLALIAAIISWGM